MALVYPGAPATGVAYGNAAPYAIIAATAITRSVGSVVNGSVALSPGSSITGTGTVTGSQDAANTAAANAKAAADGLHTLLQGKTGVAPPTFGGTISVASGTYVVAGVMSVSGTVNLTGAAGSQYFFVSSGASIGFATGTIINLGLVNAWDVFWSADTSIIDDGGSNLAGIMTAGTSGTLNNTRLNGVLFAGTGQVTTGVNTIITLPTYPGYSPSPVCYLEGTKILTSKGYLAIEDIRVGDILATKGTIYNNTTFVEENTLQPAKVAWVSKFVVKNPGIMSFPVCITKNALKTGPFEDLFVSPFHRMLVDGKLVLAIHLVNETTIFQDTTPGSITYYHVELDRHLAIVANGVLSESYLEDDNRSIFEDSPRIVKHAPLKLLFGLSS